LARLTGLTRAAAADRLVALADRDDRLVVGLDFGFSLPAWYLAEVGIASAPELWAAADRLEGWLRACPAPFWGRPGRPRPRLPEPRHWRLTELATLPRPKSMFQIGGAGAVGTASLRGMPVLDRLSRAGFAVWPMDRPRLPVVLEVWPRLCTGPVVKSRPEARRAWLAARPAGFGPRLLRVAEASADAFDAAASALALAGALTRPAGLGLAARPEAVVSLEGWIWGVPLPADHRPTAAAGWAP
jgi:hypothetical protein